MEGLQELTNALSEWTVLFPTPMPEIFLATPVISGMCKTTHFKFCWYVQGSLGTTNTSVGYFKML